MLFPVIAALIFQVTPPVNTLCPVMGSPVDAKSPTVEVKGKGYWVCCPACIEKMKRSPDKYLNEDGTPKNAPKK